MLLNYKFFPPPFWTVISYSLILVGISLSHFNLDHKVSFSQYSKELKRTTKFHFQNIKFLVLLIAVGAWFPVSQLEEQEVIAYRLIEKEKMNKNMKEFLDICASQKVDF